MTDIESINRAHQLRKSRVGSVWWKFLKDLKREEEISGAQAMFICDSYGIRHSDLIFWMDVMGCKINMDEFFLEINKKEHLQSLMRQCNEYRDRMDKCTK